MGRAGAAANAKALRSGTGGRSESCRKGIRAMPAMLMCLKTRWSSIPWREPSRPRPDGLTPPKGATWLLMSPVLTPTVRTPAARPRAARGQGLGHGSGSPGLSFHHGFARESSRIAEPQDSGAMADQAYQVPAARVHVRGSRLACSLQARVGHAPGNRQVPVRLGRSAVWSGRPRACPPVRRGGTPARGRESAPLPPRQMMRP